jgi:hypothetical protein
MKMQGIRKLKARIAWSCTIKYKSLFAETEVVNKTPLSLLSKR